MEILVDHLTRMATGYICVAGLADDGRHVRPVLERRRLHSALLAEHGGPFAIGTVVDLGPVKADGRIPEVEDHLFDPRKARAVSEPDPRLLWQRLEADAELRLIDIFGHDLSSRGRGAVVPVDAGHVSLGTLAPGYRPKLRIVKGKLRCALTDPVFGELDLSVTDVSFYREVEHGWVLDEERVADAQARLKDGTAVLLSVGLSRPWPDDDPAHWLQINNLHFTPTVRDTGDEPAPTADRTPVHVIDTTRTVGSGERAPRSGTSGLPDRLSASERAVWEALGTLPESWHVFFGVQWQSLRRGTPGDGEADFVLVHPTHGLVVIEVKGGGIRIENGVWYTDNRRGSYAINPFEQALSSKKALLQYLHDSIGALPWIPAGHAVWFPDVRVARALGPAAPREVILDLDDLDDATSAIERICEHWELQGRIDPPHLERITRLLAPTIEIRQTLSDELGTVKRQLLDLTESQQRAFRGLRSARRLVVYGGAGTGKTVLATERARQLSNEGLHVLLTCFNRPLGDHLANLFASDNRVDAGSFHRLTYGWARQTGLPFPHNPAPEWWDQPAAELVLEASSALPYGYDAVLVDEGQDFSPSWLIALESLMTDPTIGQFVVFADNHQALYQTGWEPPFEATRFDLDVNVRNARPIASVVARVVGDPQPEGGVDGPAVMFVPLDRADRLPKTLGRLVHRLTREEKLRPDELVILTQTKDDRDLLVGVKLGGQSIVDLDAPHSGIVCETIHRFKGLEADAAIVVLRKLETDYDRKLAYIGMSRARIHLTVVGPPEIGAYLHLGESPDD